MALGGHQTGSLARLRSSQLADPHVSDGSTRAWQAPVGASSPITLMLYMLHLVTINPQAEGHVAHVATRPHSDRAYYLTGW